ncbi:unnamed protein product [Brassica napus]|uniref:(rape) hypothetical protein n=1 Tax=Brassica napus TaxID=3708 RepID=A0A817ATW7_BRANA|nr:unnamed protein product [Brassica napus]
MASVPSKKRSRMLRCRLGVHKLWRLSSPRWYQMYKNHGLQSSPQRVLVPNAISPKSNIEH